MYSAILLVSILGTAEDLSAYYTLHEIMDQASQYRVILTDTNAEWYHDQEV